MKPKNPFIVTGYHSPEYFCDRETETKKIISAIENGRNVTLFSLRRMGKTGLIENVFYLLGKSKEHALFNLDILPTNNLANFIDLFGKALLGSFDSKPEQVIQKIFKAFGGLRPVINYDSLTGAPSVQFNIQNEKEAANSLDRIFEYLNKQERKIIIAIDEFQQILNYPEKNVEAMLRANIQKVKNINFIFSGSQKHLLLSIFGEHKRPFYQSTELMHLNSITPLEYSEFIKQKFLKGGMLIDNEEINYIIEWTRIHTFYTQFVCNKLYESGTKKISIEDIKRCFLTILNENEPLYLNYRNLLSDFQWILLKAIAKEGSVKNITSKDFIYKYRLNTPSSVHTAVKSLLSKELIFNEDGIYWVYDVFMSRWLERLN
jgi:hypothetical protein